MQHRTDRTDNFIGLKTLKKVLLLVVGTVASVSAHSQANDDSPLRRGLVFQDVENETYKVKLGFRIQPLFTTNFRDFEVLDDPQLIETGMQIRRARIKLDGYLGDPRWVYKLELALGNRNLGGTSGHTSLGARIILDAVVKYQIDGGKYSFWFGQTKLPGNRERVVSSQKLQFVDRSLANSRFNLDRDMGFQFHGKEKFLNSDWKWAVAISQGEGRNITDLNAGGFEYTARAEWLPLGQFTNKGDYLEADIYREESLKLSIGATYDFNNDAVRTRSNQGSWLEDAAGTFYPRDISTVIMDVMAKYNGWSMTAEWFDRTVNDPVIYDEQGNFLDVFYAGSAWSSQLGYVFKSNWEVAGRYTRVTPDEVVGGAFEQYTLGISRYVYGHNIKVQTDVSFTNMVETAESDPLMFRFQIEIGI